MDAIELRPSRRLALGLAVGVALALIAIARAALPIVIQLLLGLVVVALGYQGWGRARVAATFRVAADGSLHVRNSRGEWDAAEVLADSLVTRALVVLRYRVGDGPSETRVILPDSASADEIRRLRVSLRWARRTRSDTASPDAD